MAQSMPGILAGISGAGAVPGTSNGFGFPNATFSTGLNLPFRSDTGPPAGRNLSNLGMPGSQFFAARQPKYIDGLQSFLSIPAHYVILTDSAPNNSNSGFEARRLSVGMLLFARNHLKASNRAETRPSYGVPVGSTCIEAKELFQLNQFLYNNSALYKNAKSVVSEWILLGTFKNETANNGTWSKAYGDAARSRIINVIVSHRVATLNYWINYDLVVGQPLYLIVKRDAKGHWQIIPWADSHKIHPAIDDLYFEWESENGKINDLGLAIHVGFSGHDQVPKDMGLQKGALGVTKSLIERGVLSTIDVHLRLGTHV
jgi:hypothetical protein